MKGPDTYDLTLEDLSSSISIIGSMLEQYERDADNPPPIIHAAVTLLRQTQRHFTDLHYFIENKLGELLVTVPRSGAFYFDQISQREPKFLNVRIRTKEEYIGELDADMEDLIKKGQKAREKEEARLYPDETEEMMQERKKKEKAAQEENNIEYALKIGEILSAKNRAVLIDKLAAVDTAD